MKYEKEKVKRRAAEKHAGAQLMETSTWVHPAPQFLLENALPTRQLPGNKEEQGLLGFITPAWLSKFFTQVVLPPLGISVSMCTTGLIFVLTEDSIAGEV